MVQFNLLPDVKLEYLKTRRTKRMVMLASFTATGLAIFITVLLFLIVYVFQKQHINNLNADIDSKTKELKSVQDLDKVLTVQNQLNSLTNLHEEKPASSRLYNYLVQITPKDAKITEVSLNTEENKFTIDGSAVSLETINRFVDILKFTDFKDGDKTDKAFSEVVLSNFGVSQNSGNQGRTSYSLEFKYKPEIFDNTKAIELVVPNIVSTRSATEAPTDLFEPQSNPVGESQ